MPLYSYECKCGVEFETVKSMAERATASCPKCSEIADKVVGGRVSVVGFQLGWFEHITTEPVYVKNKAQLRALCEEHNCYATGFD